MEKSENLIKDIEFLGLFLSVGEILDRAIEGVLLPKETSSTSKASTKSRGIALLEVNFTQPRENQLKRITKKKESFAKICTVRYDASGQAHCGPVSNVKLDRRLYRSQRSGTVHGQVFTCLYFPLHFGSGGVIFSILISPGPGSSYFAISDIQFEERRCVAAKLIQ